MTEPDATPPRTLSRRKKIILAMVLAVGLAGFLEAGASVIYFLLVPRDARTAVEAAVGLVAIDPNSAMRFRPHPYLGYTGNAAYSLPDGIHPFQAPGVRASRAPLGDSASGSVRIVAIGGSTTFGLSDPDGSHSWPALVEARAREHVGERARVDVVNAGLPAYTTFELLGVATMWLPEWKPDIVLVHCGLNDAFAVAFPDEGGLDSSSFRHAWAQPSAPDIARAAMRHSYLARLVGMRAFTPSGFGLGDLCAAIQYPPPSDAEVAANVPRATGKYFRRNLKTIVSLIQRLGAIPVLVSEPLNPDKETGQGAYNDAVSQAVLRNNVIMAEVGREQGVLVIDAFSRMRDPACFTDACHETDKGMQVKATAVADALQPVIEQVLAQKAARVAP